MHDKLMHDKCFRNLVKEGRKERKFWTRERIDTRVPVSTQGATLSKAAPRGPQIQY
jgi:hypothetical protein